VLPLYMHQKMLLFKLCVSRGKLSTYKELCSLASDLNQPDLVYKFMALANHNALWNSKKVKYRTLCT